MKPGIGKLEIFPSIWGRKFTANICCHHKELQAYLSQTGLEALATVRMMPNGWTSSCHNFLRRTSGGHDLIEAVRREVPIVCMAVTLVIFLLLLGNQTISIAFEEGLL